MRTDRIALALAACALALAAPAPAAAAQSREDDSAGELRLTIAAAAKRKLGDGGIEISAVGAARVRGRRLTVPVAGGEVGTVARLKHSGGVRLRAGRRVVRVRGLALTLGSARGLLTARFAGEQRTLLRVAMPQNSAFNSLTGEVGLEDAAARVPGAARAELAGALRLKRFPRRLGRVSVEAIVDRAEAERTEAPTLARPASAVDVTSATLTWRTRESFIDYLHAAGDAGGTTVADGATNGPAEVISPSTTARVYQFDFPFAHGWYDSPSATAGVYFGGLLNFHKLVDPYNIDLDATAPEVELTGGEARLIARLFGRGNNADEQGRRAIAVDLEQEAVTPSVTTASGVTTYTYEHIPAVVPDGSAAWPIADFYQPGTAWGWITVSFTVAEPASP